MELEKSLNILLEKNKTEISEIYSCLNYIKRLEESDGHAAHEVPISGISKSIYINKCCSYEQQLNKKLVEIKYELKKMLNESVFVLKEKIEPECDINIETIKENSLKLLDSIEKNEICEHFSFISKNFPHIFQTCIKPEIVEIKSPSLIPFSEQIKMFEIIDPRKKLEINSECYITHIVSPSEFYIHLLNDEFPINNLYESLNDYRKSFEGPEFTSKFEVSEHIERYCCVFDESDQLFHRAEIKDWGFFSRSEEDDNLVEIQLIDYGTIKNVHYKYLREITTELIKLPKIAIKCYFPSIFPFGSTKSKVLKEWSKTAIEDFKYISKLYKSFKVCSIRNEEKSDMIGIDLYQFEEKVIDTIRRRLISLGHAIQINFRYDDKD